MSILNLLERERVLEIRMDMRKETVSLIEMCDQYFHVELNRQQLTSLIGELTTIQEHMCDAPISDPDYGGGGPEYPY